jgi:hypothetical protein
MKNVYIDKRLSTNGKRSSIGLNNSLNLKKFIEQVIGLKENVVNITYLQLYNKVNTSSLTIGTYYIITDFRTCYDRPDYDQFKSPIAVSNSSYIVENIDPIMVFATSANSLALDAYQLSSNDKLKYDIFYNVTESGNPAKGRITERIDEFGNRTDYDHKTIYFKRYTYYTYSKNSPLVGTIELQSDGTVLGLGTTFLSTFISGQIIAIPNTTEVFYQISSILNDSTLTVVGNQITPTGSGGYSYFNTNTRSDDSYYQNNIEDPNTIYSLYITFDATCYNNYIGDHSVYFQEEGNGDFLLANNVFKDGNYENNTIGDSSYNNTFNDDCTANQIGYAFRNNITDDDFDRNVIGNYFTNNIITANFQYNQIGDNFEYNTIINDSFYRNQIGNNFYNNWLDSDLGFEFQNNQIANQFNDNIIFEDFYKNRILNGYNNNEIFYNFAGNDIGNAFNDNKIYQNFYDNKIKDYFNNNTIGDINNMGDGEFIDNVINNNFKGNLNYGNFLNNQIGNDFVSNTTDYYFSNNVIGNNASTNNISFNFAYNKIGNNFLNNTILNDFGFGGDIPRGNVIGNTFQSNTIGEYFYDNVICDNFISNTIVDNFQFNNFAYHNGSTDFTLSTHVYGNYNCKVVRGSDSNYYLQYFDGTIDQYVTINS